MAYEASKEYRDWRGAAMDELRHHSGFYLGLGIALIVLGLIAIAFAVFSTLLSVVFVGVLLLLGGIVQAGHAFGTRTWSGFFLHLLASILYVVAGLIMVSNPGVGALSLTLMLAVFFMVGGLFRVFGAVFVRFPSWGWVVVNGIITFVLGVLIAAQWPSSSLWVIGAFVGIDMIFSGWSFVMLSMAARNIGRYLSTQEPPTAFA